jgi:type I restriction enzyme S subunit
MGKTILSKELVTSGLPVYSASIGAEPWGYVEDWSTTFPRGTLVVSARGTIGDVKLPEHDLFVSTQTTIALQPSGAFVPSFLRKQLSAFDWPSVTATTAIPMLTIGKLDEIVVRIPPLPEQRRIVAKLDALTARTARARADLDRIPSLAARYKQAVLAKAFSGELTIAAPVHSGGHETQTVALQELCESITDGDHQAPPKSDSGVPFITISAMNDGRLDLSKARRFVPRDYLDSLKPSRVARQGDVLYSVTGSFGIPALVGTDEAFVFQRHIAILKPSLKRTSGHFLSLMLRAPQILEQAKAVATGTAQLTVPLSGLRRFKLPAPNLSEQDEIIRIVEQAFCEIDRLVAESAAARRLLDRLDQANLAKAFRGELVPQDPADEPASALLDRVRAERAAAPKTRRRLSPRTSPTRKKTDMPKSRLDDDVKHQPFLASILKASGTGLSADSLFESADLPITDFYKQLAWEIDNGLVRQRDETLEAA